MENPEKIQPHVADDEIDLVQLVQILLKRKVMIISITLLSIIVAVGVCFILPKVYEVNAILELGKDATGHPIENPQVVRENILGGAYDQLIVNELKIKLDNFPKFNVSVPKTTNLIKVSIESDKPEEGVKILEKLLSHVSNYLLDRLEIKLGAAENMVKEVETKGQSIDEQIRVLQKQIVQIESTMVELGNGRRDTLAKSSDNAMAVLLYSNEIQNQQIYLNNLQMKRTNLDGKKRENLIEIDNAKLKLSAIKGTNINKYPIVPNKPIKPKKKLIVALAAMLGLMGGIMLAFGAEFMAKVREQQ